MKAFKFFSGILYLAMLSVFLLACTDTPIFYTLEKAYAIGDDRGLDDDAVVTKIVYTGTRYFVAAQSVYQRDEGPSGRWQRVTPPADGALCGGLEFFSVTGNIIAWFYNSADLKPVGLYSRDPSSSATAAWTGPITDTAWPTSGDWPGQQFRIHFVKEVNNLLFVSSSVYDSGGSTTTYRLYYSGTAGSDSFTACNTDYGTALNNQIIDVEWDGTDYWFITTPGDSGGSQPIYLYQNAAAGDPSDFDDVSAAGPAFWKNGSDDPAGTLYTPNSLYYAPAPTDKLYLSGWHGRIFIHSGGSWSTWPAVADQPDRKTVEIGRDDYTVQFTAFVDTGKNSQIFVGSMQYGYFYFSNSKDGTAALTPSDLKAAASDYEYFPADLEDGAIRSFLIDTEDPANMLFACTAKAGLWRGDWSSTESLWIWKQE
jgi:hypothetical protein